MARIGLDVLRSLIKDCLGYDREIIINNPNQWGSLTFEDIKNEIESLFDILQELNNLPLNLLPSDIVHQAAQHLQQVIDFLGKINEFNLQFAQEPPAPKRADFAVRLAAAINNFQKIIIPFIPYLHSKALKVDDYQKEKEEIEALKQATNDALAKAEATQAELTSRLETATNLLEATKNITAASGVSKHSGLFEKEWQENLKDRKAWMISMGLLIATTIFTAIIPLFIEIPNKEWWQILTTKLFILTLLLGLTFWCARIFTAKLHQAAINKHRANALGTFDTFIESATDPAIRDAILMETTKSIFALSSTGYLKGEGEVASDGAKIIEVTRNIAQTAKAAH